jgi:hypothetical protein
MIIMLVNKKYQTEMENSMQKTRSKTDSKQIKDDSEDLNELIQKMSNKLPRSELDEYESNHSSDEFNPDQYFYNNLYQWI